MNQDNIKADLDRRVIFAELDNGSTIDLAEIECLEDGFWVVWKWLNTGALESWVIRAVADRLDQINESWAKQIDDYFSSDLEQISND